MNRRVSCLIVLVALLLVPWVARAQEEEASLPFAYSTYHECTLNDQWLADKIVENAFAPAYDAAVEAGTITGWGYLAHHTGGKWRRAIYHVASDTDALFDSLVSINEQIDKDSPEASAKFSEICGAHDDYVWRFSAGSGSMEDALVAREGAGVSAYFVCDASREERADELVKEVLGPVFNAHVGEDGLSSWAWFQHRIGGKYRRLLGMSGADAKTLMRTRGKIFPLLIAEHTEAFAEFNSICGSHQDYLWDIVIDNP